MLCSAERPEQVVLEGIDVNLPTATAIPVSFIVNELITNAAKYGKGRIRVRLLPNPERGYTLSVSSSDSVLPQGFDPAAGKGLGMRLIRSFVARIGGELRIG
jgi:two-component sensor histidine kinase